MELSIDVTASKGQQLANATDSKAGELIRLCAQLSSDRALFETQWQEVAQFVQPNESRSFRFEWVNLGEKRNILQYDVTAGIALQRFVAIMDSLLTPIGQTWHTLETDNMILNRNKSVQEYFYALTRALFRERYAAKANFVETNQMVWEGLGAFGTSFQFIDQLYGQRGLRYKYIPLGNMYITENHQGRFDRYFRKYRYTAHQAVLVFGDKLPWNIIEAARTTPTQRFDFLNVVEENENYDPERRDWKGKKWVSYDICIMGNIMLKVQGYNSCPYIGTRFSTSLEEPYGRSPAMTVLPTIKTLNQEKKAMITQAHRAMNPIYLTHDDGVLSNMAVTPGNIVAGGVDSQGRILVHPLMPGNIQLAKENMDDDRNDIKSAFFTDLFQILVETPEMTATEVMERIKEKGILLSPCISRQEQYLGDVVHREMDLMHQFPKLYGIPPMPKILQQAGGEYNIRFESPLAKMRRAEEASGFMRLMEQALQMAQATQDPSVMHYFNFDEAIPAMARIGGVPPKWMNTMDKVQQLRAAQAQQAQTQNLIQAGPAAAAVLKALPKNAGGGGT